MLVVTLKVLENTAVLEKALVFKVTVKIEANLIKIASISYCITIK